MFIACSKEHIKNPLDVVSSTELLVALKVCFSLKMCEAAATDLVLLVMLCCEINKRKVLVIGA